MSSRANYNAGSSVPSQRAFCPESVRHILFTAFSNYYSFITDVFQRIATSLDPSSVYEYTRKLQYNIFVYIVNCHL